MSTVVAATLYALASLAHPAGADDEAVYVRDLITLDAGGFVHLRTEESVRDASRLCPLRLAAHNGEIWASCAR